VAARDFSGDEQLIFDHLADAKAAAGTCAQTIVVGGGTVGLLLAVRLARAGRRVLVLEAGPKYLSKDSQRHFELARNIGRQLDGLHLGRFRCLGGTSNFWGGQLVRFDPLVFQSRPWVEGGAAWPISYDDIAPYYPQVFSCLGMAQVEEDADVVRRLDMSVPPLPAELDFTFTRWAREPNFVTLFENDLRKLSNLQIVTNAQVTALTMAADDRHVTGVEVVDLDGTRARFAASEVVLANGTIEIARLLMQPLADGRPSSWGANPWLGRGFIDHVDCVAGAVKLHDARRFHLLFDNVIVSRLKYQPKLRASEAGQRSRSLLGIAAHFIFRSSAAENLENAKIFLKGMLKGRFEGGLTALPRQIRQMATIGAPMVLRYLRYNRMYNPADLGIQLRLTSEQIQVAESGIRLRSDKDAFGMPLIDMDWKIDGAEIETLACFGEIVAGYLREAGLAAVSLDADLVSRNARFLDKIDDANHHIGMARMSHSPADGVVDAELRVHGSDNLYVAGSAVYPSSGFANPTFTALALALRLADRITAGAR